MNLKLGIWGAMLGGGAMIYGASMADRGMNYAETDAVVTETKVDCFVKNGKRYLAEKATDEMAYMDCGLAKLAAARFNYPESSVQKRFKLKFSYTSAADGSKQFGSYETEYGDYKNGQKTKIYSHKKEPKTMRWS